MGAFIARQPNGLLCRFSTTIDCITDYNMTEEDYINLCVERAKEQVKEDAKNILARHIKSFDMVEENFIPNNMTEEEFKKVLEDMERPADQCEHVKI